MAKMKKAQSGIEAALEAKTAARKTKGPALREGQMSRLDRIAGSNPDRAIKVGKRMLKRAAPKAQNGIAKMAKKDPKEAMKKGMNFDKKSFDSLPKLKTKKAEKGGKFGMLSVKAGVDKNPNPTAADRIAGAKKKMQYGGEAASMVPMMKKGGTKKKYKHGGTVSMELGSYDRQIGKNYTGKNTKAVGLTKAMNGKAMSGTAMMKKGGKAKMGKCKSGC